MNQIKIENLNFQFRDSTIFKDFNFTTNNQLTLLKGSSGCGKTTLLKILFGDIVENHTVTSVDIPDIKYLVLQEDALLPWLNGYSNIELVSKNIKESILKELFLHIRAFLDKKTSKISFGQRRLIELYRAFLQCPKLLLLDEPFNYLDKKSRLIVSRTINEYLGFYKENMIIMSSHYSEDIEILKPKTYYFKDEKPHKQLFEDAII